MTFLLQLYPGDQTTRMVAMVIGQVALIVFVAFILSRFPTRRRAVTGSAIWLATLACVLLAPLLAGGLEFAKVTLVRLPMLGSTTVEAEVPSPTPTPPAFSEPDVPNIVPQENVEESSNFPVAAELPQAVESRSPMVASRSFSRTDKWRAAGSCLMLLWFVGVSVCVIRFLSGCLALTHLRKDVREVDETAIAAVLEDVCRTLDMHNIPKLVASQSLTGPVATSGLSGQMVILPQRLLDELNHRQLRDVLTHECAHLAQRDILIGILQRIAQIIYWPHLMVHLLNRELHSAREDICDNHVLRQGDAPGYARTLVQLSAVVHVKKTPVAACGILSPVSRLETRVAQLLNERRDLMTRTKYSSLVLFGLVFLTMSVLIFGTRPASGQNTNANRSDAEKKAIEIEEKVPQGPKPAQRKVSPPSDAVKKQIAVLIKVLADPKADSDNLELTRQSIKELTRIGPAAVPQLVRAIRGGNSTAAPYSDLTLREMGQPAVPEVRVEWKKLGEVDRWKLMRFRGQHDYKASVDFVLTSLNSKNKNIRQQAIIYLGRHKETKAHDGLLKRLNTEAPRLRWDIIDALTLIGGEGVVEAFIALLKPSSWLAKGEGRLNPPSGVPYWWPDGRPLIVKSLRKLKARKSSPHLMKVLREKGVDKAYLGPSIIPALAEFGYQESIPELKRIVAADPRDIRQAKEVQALAKRAIQVLTAEPKTLPPAGKLNFLSPKEIADGWMLIFDGKTTKGWTARQIVNRAYWKFATKNGVMILETKKGGFAKIEHDSTLRHFNLKGEYRVSGRGETPWAALWLDLKHTDPSAGNALGVTFPATDQWRTFTVQLALGAKAASVAGKVVHNWNAPTGPDKDRLTPVVLVSSRITFFVPERSTTRLQLRNLKLRSLDPAP